MKKVAVIDIGSNTIKLLVASSTNKQSIQSHFQAIEECRISKGISQDCPQLTEDSMARGLTAVLSLLRQAEEHKVPRDQIKIVATSAVRDALNGRTFTERILEASGHSTTILSGDEEAQLIAEALRFDPELSALSDYIHFDLGGGSLECNFVKNGSLTFTTSMPLGAVRLTEQCVSAPREAFTKEDASKIDQQVRQSFQNHQIPTTTSTPVIFTGGSATISRALIHNRPLLSSNLGTNMIYLSELNDLLKNLAPLEFQQRLKFEYLPKNRADVVCAAIQVLISTIEIQNQQRFQHSRFSLRHGIAVKLLES